MIILQYIYFSSIRLIQADCNIVICQYAIATKYSNESTVYIIKFLPKHSL